MFFLSPSGCILCQSGQACGPGDGGQDTCHVQTALRQLLLVGAVPDKLIGNAKVEYPDARHDVQYYRFKNFNQRYDDEAKSRLAG